jgi:hypothetical protein
LDGFATGTVASTFLTPRVWPKFCDKRSDAKGEVVGVMSVPFKMEAPLQTQCFIQPTNTGQVCTPVLDP